MTTLSDSPVRRAIEASYFPSLRQSILQQRNRSHKGRSQCELSSRTGRLRRLGSFEAGTQLDFFLIANGANGGTTTYSTDATTSPDGLTHAISWAPADSPYLLIGFEDLLGGGDGDFNDLLFAVAIQPLTTAPEPSTMLLLTSFLLVVLYLRHSSRFSPHSNPEQYPRIN